MEFNEKLKALRHDRGISQQALADAIFVSRSAVAKWENGLGMPGKESMDSLIAFFDVDADYFKTYDAEDIIVQKNVKIRNYRATITVGACILAAILIAGTVLYAVGFRLSPDHFIKPLDWPAMRRGNYVFYLGVPANDDGSSRFDTFVTVRRYGFLYRSVKGEMQKLETGDGRDIGTLYSFDDGDTTHYFFMSARERDKEDFGVMHLLFPSHEVTVNGKVIPLYRDVYFSLDEPIESMEILGESVVFSTYGFDDLIEAY